MTETRFIGGSLWMVAMRWTMRLIGLVSVIILARLLSPEDFGLVAMAVIVVGLVEIMANTGVDLALVRDRSATREHYDTAWTIQVIQGALVTGLLILLIEPAAIYFDEPRVRAALGVLALRPFIDGFRNIGIVAFRKELDFAREFRFQVFHKLAGFVIVVVLAFLWRSYWALIVGRLAAGVTGIAISYMMHAYRPRFTMSRFSEIWSFGQWLLLSRIGVFGSQQADKFAVGGTAGTDAMGGYHIAKELGSMLSDELVYPIRRALFPNFAVLQGQRERFNEGVLMLLSVVATLVIAMQFGLASVAPDFVEVVLGPRWTHISGLITILAFAGTASALTMTVEFLLPVTNRTRLAAIAAWLELSTLVTALLVVAGDGDLMAIAYARMAVGIIFVPVMLVLVSRSCGISLTGMLGVLWRPLTAGAVMYLGLQALHPYLFATPALRLVATIVLGAVLFSATLASLWWIAGRPPGIERQIRQRL